MFASTVDSQLLAALLLSTTALLLLLLPRCHSRMFLTKISALRGRAARRRRLDAVVRRVNRLSHLIWALDEQSSNYSNLFIQSEWHKIVACYENVRVAATDLAMHHARGRKAEFERLWAALHDDARLTPMVNSVTRADTDMLVDWEARTEGLLARLIGRLDRASCANREIGLVRARQKRPTADVLQDLTFMLNTQEERPFRRVALGTEEVPQFS